MRIISSRKISCRLKEKVVGGLVQHIVSQISIYIGEIKSFKFIIKKVTILILCIILFQLGIYEDQTSLLESNRGKMNNEFSIMADSIFVFL